MKTYSEEIKKSKFIAYRIDLTNLEVIEPTLNQIKQQHKKATHICFAYVYSKDQVQIGRAHV